MDRLTMQNYEYASCEFMDSGIAPVFNRLAAYEDTGLEPEEIKSLKETWDLFGGADGIQSVYVERDKYKQAESKAVPVVRCKDCIYWKPPHVLQNDGTEREYNPETDIDDLGLLMVTTDVGINIGGQCYVDHNRGYAEDKVVFRNENDFCSKGYKGCNYPLNGGADDD